MPTTNLISSHFTAAEMGSVNDALTTILNILQPKSQNLSPEERRTLGSINENNKLVVQKVYDYHKNQPQMSSPDIDWAEFESDLKDRNFLEAVLTQLAVISEVASDTKILHDHDVYRIALLDYDYTKYKMGTNASGFDTKYVDIKQFFPNPSGSNGSSDNGSKT